MKDTAMGEDHCPKCGDMLDTCAAMEDESTPMPGDFTICMCCAGVLQFGSDMRLIAIDESDDGPLAKAPIEFQVTIMKYKLAIKLAHAKQEAPSHH